MDALASPQYKDDPQPADAAVARESEAIVVAATLKIRDTITHREARSAKLRPCKHWRALKAYIILEADIVLKADWVLANHSHLRAHMRRCPCSWNNNVLRTRLSTIKDLLGCGLGGNRLCWWDGIRL